jgi:hypothetical protein
MDQHEQYDEYDERPFDLSGGGLANFFNKLWNRKIHKLYTLLTEKIKALTDLKNEIVSNCNNFESNSKILALSAVTIVYLILSASEPNNSIHDLRIKFFKDCEAANSLISKVRDLEHKFYIIYESAKKPNELINKIGEKKLKNFEAKHGKTKLLFPDARASYGIEFGSNPSDFTELETSSSEIQYNSKINAIDKLKKEVDSAIKKLITSSYFAEKNAGDETDNLTKINALLSSAENTMSDLYCTADNINKLMKYYFYKSNGSISSIINFETGTNSIIFPKVPVILQYFFHEFSKDPNSTCVTTLNFYGDQDILTKVADVKRTLKSSTLFKSSDINIKSEDYSSKIPYTLLFYAALLGKNVTSRNVLIGEMLSMGMNLVNEKIAKSSNINDVSVDISVVFERFILRSQYRQLLNMCWIIYKSTGLSLSSDYLRIVTYKMLNTSDVPAFLNIKADALNDKYMKENEAKRIAEELNLLKSIDLQSTDVFMLMGGSNDSIAKIKDSFSGDYESQIQGYHLNLFKKTEHKDKTISSKFTVNPNYIITEALLNGQTYVFVNLYMPFIKISSKSRENKHERKTELSDILTALGKEQKILTSDNPVIIFASLNYNNFMEEKLVSLEESTSGGVAHSYLDFGAGGFQILALPSSIYYFDYNIVETTNPDNVKVTNYFLSKIFTEEQRLHNLDYIFYKFPEKMDGYKINITTPIKKTINIIIEGVEKPKEPEKKKEESSATNIALDEYIEISDVSEANSISIAEGSVEETEESGSGKFISSYVLKKNVVNDNIIEQPTIDEYKAKTTEFNQKQLDLNKLNAEKTQETNALSAKTSELTAIDKKIKDSMKQVILVFDKFESVTKTNSSTSAPFPLNTEENKNELLNAILKNITEANTPVEIETNGAGAANNKYLKIGGTSAIKDNDNDNIYKIKLKNTFRVNDLKAGDLHKINTDNIELATLANDIEQLKSKLLTIDSIKTEDIELAKIKEDLKQIYNKLNEQKLEAEDYWKYVEKQPSNHQLCAFEIVKKGAKVSSFDKTIVPEVKKLLQEYEIPSKEFNISGKTSEYNQYMYLLEIFNKILNIKREGGIDKTSFIKSVINLFYYRDKKLYKEEDFKVSSASKEIVVGGGNPKQLSHKRNIIISVMNPKSIDYSALKLKNRTNKKKLGCVRKRSRCKYSKHKRHSKRVA